MSTGRRSVTSNSGKPKKSEGENGQRTVNPVVAGSSPVVLDESVVVVRQDRRKNLCRLCALLKLSGKQGGCH